MSVGSAKEGLSKVKVTHGHGSTVVSTSTFGISALNLTVAVTTLLGKYPAPMRQAMEEELVHVVLSQLVPPTRMPKLKSPDARSTPITVRVKPPVGGPFIG